MTQNHVCLNLFLGEKGRAEMQEDDFGNDVGDITLT